eukprot:g4293.t1
MRPQHSCAPHPSPLVKISDRVTPLLVALTNAVVTEEPEDVGDYLLSWLQAHPSLQLAARPDVVGDVLRDSKLLRRQRDSSLKQLRELTAMLHRTASAMPRCSSAVSTRTDFRSRSVTWRDLVVGEQGEQPLGGGCSVVGGLDACGGVDADEQRWEAGKQLSMMSSDSLELDEAADGFRREAVVTESEELQRRRREELLLKHLENDAFFEDFDFPRFGAELAGEGYFVGPKEYLPGSALVELPPVFFLESGALTKTASAGGTSTTSGGQGHQHPAVEAETIAGPALHISLNGIRKSGTTSSSPSGVVLPATLLTEHYLVPAASKASLASSGIGGRAGLVPGSAGAGTVNDSSANNKGNKTSATVYYLSLE